MSDTEGGKKKQPKQPKKGPKDLVDDDMAVKREHKEGQKKKAEKKSKGAGKSGKGQKKSGKK
ncbi:translation machinery-associated protein 7-like isoform X3 [Branchiostoma floridae x Branchiostoma belcheri]